MLHTIRQLIDNDDKWRSILRGLNKEFYHQTVSSKQIEDYIIDKSGLDLHLVFDQYLRGTMIPTFEYLLKDGKMRYRWTNCVRGFKMPVKVWINGKVQNLNPSQRWNKLELESPINEVQVDKDYYVASFEITRIN